MPYSKIKIVLALFSFATLIKGEKLFAQIKESDPKKAVASIEAILKSQKEKQPWEGIYTKQWPLGGRTIYIVKDQWAEACGRRTGLGITKEEKGHLELFTAGPPKATYEKFLIVPWAQRVYLIEESRLLRFINAVNEGAEPVSDGPGLFFVREEGLKAEVKGNPILPKNLQKFLFDTPYKGKISAIQGDIKSFDIPNYGESEDGIVIEISPVDSRPAFIGMRLIFKDAMNDYRAVVYKIQDKSIFAIVPKTLMFQGRQPKLGDQLSSKISH